MPTPLARSTLDPGLARSLLRAPDEQGLLEQPGRLPAMTSQPPVGLRRLRELRVRRRIERQIAPLGVRLLAVLVSATMAIGFLAALLAAGAGGLRIWRRLRPPQAPLPMITSTGPVRGWGAARPI